MPSQDYLEGFIKRAKKYLPDYLIDDFHKNARAYAGGKSKGKNNSVNDNIGTEEYSDDMVIALLAMGAKIEKSDSIIGYTDEMLKFSDERNKEHIDLVQKNMEALSGFKDLKKDDLTARGKDHDKSKFEKDEKDPYIWLTVEKGCKRKGEKFSFPKGVKKQIEKATEHHVKSNPHHPESHSNINKMSDMDIVEMVSDWTAMAQELDQNEGSAKQWADENISKRWKFNKEKTDLIYETIKELDSRNKIAKENEEDLINCEILKAVEDQQIVMGIALKPEKLDGEGDYMTGPEVEKAAHGWMLNSRKIGFRHKGVFNEKDVKVVESYLAPQDLVFDGRKVKKGSWIVALKIFNSQLWKLIKEGKLKAFSPGGWGKRQKIA